MIPFISIGQKTVDANIDLRNYLNFQHSFFSFQEFSRLAYPLNSCSVEPVDAVMSVDFLLVAVDWAASYWSSTLPLALCGSLIHNFGLFSLNIRLELCRDLRETSGTCITSRYLWKNFCKT